ncbi:MAG: methionine--tRNA ligase [Erysipelotrichaceae bacterium]|nr:methionine--tRNA ligase [Erysipelotrichaceae bacterium]
MENKKYYITTPIYYPSANFHIGHCYTTVIADSIARYKKQNGYDVYFLTGSDEHGLKIQRKAEALGITPKEYVDKIIEDAKDLWSSLGIEYDRFIRTTDPDHVEVVQKIFKKLYDKGDIYKGEYKGLYCTPCESFWTESQLVDGKCPDCGRDVEEASEEAYFFRLSKYQDRLVEYIETHPEFIQPESRKNEMINNFIKPGLEDLCVSRTTFNWGIPVSFDPKHVIYVWIDALSNYISALGYLTEDDSKFKKYWPADLHIVGKEIVRFHTIIWPILLMALDLPLPKQVFGHGWLVINGGKISKSLGNYKDPREYIATYSKDAIRYYLLREVPFGSDGTFSEDLLVSRYNTDLANTVGNLVNRTLSMLTKYFDGVIVKSDVKTEFDDSLISLVESTKVKVDEYMDKLEIPEALDSIFEIFRRSNKYIDETTPWILAKEENKDKLKTVLYNLIESIRIGAILLLPFIPDTANEILRQINTKNITLDTITFGSLETDIHINDFKPIFMRVEKDEK